MKDNGLSIILIEHKMSKTFDCSKLINGFGRILLVLAKRNPNNILHLMKNCTPSVSYYK